MPGFGLGGTISLIAFSFFFAGSFLAGNASVFTILLYCRNDSFDYRNHNAWIWSPGHRWDHLYDIQYYFCFRFGCTGSFFTVHCFYCSGHSHYSPDKIRTQNKYLDKIILSTQLKKDKGYIAATDRASLLGREGVAVTKLRPSGMIEVDHEKIDAVTSGEFIEKDSRIKIIRVEGRKIIVKN